MDAGTYMSCMEALKPDVFQMLADCDTTPNSSAKRIKTSVDATIKFASTCIELKQKSDVLSQTPMFACLSGGYNIRERLRCVEELKKLEPDGFVIDGFHTNGTSATNLNWDQVEPILTELLGSLPAERPRVFHGPLTPVVLLKALAKGENNSNN